MGFDSCPPSGSCNCASSKRRKVHCDKVGGHRRCYRIFSYCWLVPLGPVHALSSPSTRFGFGSRWSSPILPKYAQVANGCSPRYTPEANRAEQTSGGSSLWRAFMQLRLSFWQFCSVRPAWPRLAKENARKIIAGSAANGGLRLAAYRIACARMAIGCPMRASEDWSQQVQSLKLKWIGAERQPDVRFSTTRHEGPRLRPAPF